MNPTFSKIDVAAGCSRCGVKSLVIEWDTDTRKHIVKCLACGRVQGSGVAKVIDTKPEPDPETWAAKAAKREVTILPKPRDPATKALEAYHGATTRYLEAREKLDEAEQRRADAEARVVSAADLLTAAQVQMREARARLDAELAGLGVATPAVAAAPKGAEGGTVRVQG